MKRGKDEDKVMGPMFPRLHVNDREKGGPRAPPRNKMALYEQLSIPSQSFNHTILPHDRNDTTSNSGPYSTQGSRNERGDCSSRQQHCRLTSENQCSQNSDLSSPSTQIKERKKLDKDDFAFPIFIHSRPSQLNDTERVTPSNPSHFNDSLKFPEAAKNGAIGHFTGQEAKMHKEGNSQEPVVGQNQFVKCVTKSSIAMKIEELPSRDCPLSEEPGSGRSNCIESLRLCSKTLPASGVHGAVSRKCTTASIKRAFELEDQNVVSDVANDGESREDVSCGTLQMGNLDRRESVSEACLVDAVSGLDITPDDVVGIIGQRHFWKAKRTITNQQRVFAYQVFELHRLIKVQKCIALSPNLLEDVASLGQPIKPATPPKLVPIQTSQTSLVIGKHTSSGYQTQPHGGHQWLIPVMSPSEGLVYKPYPRNSAVPPGSNPATPTYGYGTPQIPSPVPRGYFSPLCMRFMSTAFSGSSVEQDNVPSVANQLSARETNSSIQCDVNVDAYDDTEVQCSNDLVVKQRDELRLFPMSPTPTIDASHPPTRVIKVVPHNSKSASESAARIFRSIQEERRLYDSSE